MTRGELHEVRDCSTEVLRETERLTNGCARTEEKKRRYRGDESAYRLKRHRHEDGGSCNGKQRLKQMHDGWWEAELWES